MGDTATTAPGAAALSAPSGSPLLKLFGTDPIDPLGHVRPLSFIRNKIYSYAWSRERRDDFKLDWVVSESGINRNVPERFVPDTPHGTAAFKCLDKLPCNLHLVNKQISEDFTRYIYNINALEILVDLKAVHTEATAACLQEIVTQLQNPNLQKYTRRSRVRIHFPPSYPVNNLPAINQHALEDIASSFDQFEQLEHVALRVVLAQGSPLDYEIRFAAFPFYPMRMTYWSLRTLNTNVFPSSWDILDKREIKLLDQAWRIYNDSGSLTAPIKYRSVAHFPESSRPLALDVINTAGGALPYNELYSPRNGSMKRKIRKQRALASSLVSANPSSVKPLNDSEAMASVKLPIPGVEESQAIAVDAAGRGAATNAQSSDPEFVLNTANYKQYGSHPTIPPSPPQSPAQPGMTTAMMFPSFMSNDDFTVSSQVGKPVISKQNTSCPELQGAGAMDKHPQDPRPPSPASSSCTIGSTSENPTALMDKDEDGRGDLIVAGQTDIHHVQQKQAKKKRKSKKRAKSVANKAGVVQHDPVPSAALDQDEKQEDGLVSGGQDDGVGEKGSDIDIDSKSMTVGAEPSKSVKKVGASTRRNLSKLELRAYSSKYAIAKEPDATLGVLMERDIFINWHLRQQERQRTEHAERQAKNKETKEKRGIKKAKQLLLRRDTVAPNSPLSRACERQRQDQKSTRKASKSSEPDVASEAAGHIFDALIETEMFIRGLPQVTSLEREHRFNFSSTDQPSRLIEEVKEDAGSSSSSSPSDVQDGLYYSAESIPFRSPGQLEGDGNHTHGDETSLSQDLCATSVSKHSQKEFSGSATSSGQDSGQMVFSGTNPVEDSPYGCASGSPGGRGPQRARRPQHLRGHRNATRGARRGNQDVSLAKDGHGDRRTHWAAHVMASDEGLRARDRKENETRKRKLEADGAEDTTAYDRPIIDTWIKKDEDGNRIEHQTERLVYSNQKQEPSASDGHVS
ncbi:hypothetical protein M406DRAFT_67413 [Cryphonectria parasitica EP155]|uniref:Uncharacterized protein n=1 Tax=Cryphonectria parasitica (strain ATCC 38755 / EP155) TaxID=660469 RepID=A0A9P5CWE8_CRYP1|nr:uncharacterized protein M406DRAFT_67413 [Cryphonectria parasitica EP155]KAF3771080.1 hypothetical protein M406DRAFT_67413 [Cryphonectria parasitica EP155]